MSGKTLRSSLTLVLSAMILAGCANYSGLDTSGASLDAKSLKNLRVKLVVFKLRCKTLERFDQIKSGENGSVVALAH